MAAKLTDEFLTTEVKIRGTTYKFRELSATDYDSIIKIASGPDDQADLATVLKMMAVQSLVEPSLTADELMAKPYPVYNQLLKTVNKLHFDSVEENAPND